MNPGPNSRRTVWTTRREAIGMTQEELSIGSLVGITRPKAIEAGRTEPTPDEHASLERALDHAPPRR